MLIHKSTGKIILNLSNPGRVTTVIPTAKQFDFRGATLVAVPHRVEETRVLRNLGIRAPSPIKYHYAWPGPYDPFFAQSETAEFLTLNPHAFVLNDMGTGKTLASLWAFDFLKSQGLAKKLLVVSPLSTLERTWADEIFRNFPHLNVNVLYGTRDRRQKMLNEDADVYLVNHDGLHVILDDLIAKTDIDCVVVDEIASFRNAATRRWKCLHKIIAGKAHVWGMTGTPTPNLPTDAWAQCRLISPDRVPKYFGKFRDATMKQFGQFKWLPRESATEIVAEAMQPAVRFTREQCVDLPECIYINRTAPMTPEQNSAYKGMLQKLHMEYQGDQVQAVNEAVKLSKLVQIAAGVVYGADGREVILPCKPRIDAVIEAIEQAATKTIVFVPYKAVLRNVVDVLEDEFGADQVRMISGDVNKTDRDNIFREFQSDHGPTILVAQPAAMSHGLTLTAANTVVWYAPVTSCEIYIQANARVTRPGQKHTQFIVNVEGSPVEKHIYARLEGKQTMQGLLLGMLQS